MRDIWIPHCWVAKATALLECGVLVRGTKRIVFRVEILRRLVVGVGRLEMRSIGSGHLPIGNSSTLFKVKNVLHQMEITSW